MDSALWLVVGAIAGAAVLSFGRWQGSQWSRSSLEAAQSVMKATAALSAQTRSISEKELRLKETQDTLAERTTDLNRRLQSVEQATLEMSKNVTDWMIEEHRTRGQRIQDRRVEERTLPRPPIPTIQVPLPKASQATELVDPWGDRPEREEAPSPEGPIARARPT